MNPKTIAAIVGGALLGLLGVAVAGTATLPNWSGGILTTGTFVPTNGTNEVQTFTFGGALSSTLSASTIQFGFKGWSGNLTLTGTEGLNNNAGLTKLATAAIIGMTSISGTSNMTVALSGTPAVITTTYIGNLGVLDVPQMTAAVTSGTVTVTGTTTTPGVTADGRLSPQGQLIIGGTGVLYQNTGAVAAPIWQKVSAY